MNNCSLSRPACTAHNWQWILENKSQINMGVIYNRSKSTNDSCQSKWQAHHSHQYRHKNYKIHKIFKWTLTRPNQINGAKGKNELYPKYTQTHKPHSGLPEPAGMQPRGLWHHSDTKGKTEGLYSPRHARPSPAKKKARKPWTPVANLL